jgi:8-oxo-dGTP pyrophosphatase MutT (NUDIX family)
MEPARDPGSNPGGRIGGILMKHCTLCFIVDSVNNKVLLGMKKRSLGKGKWNGFGGKVEENETIEQAAIREVLEEVGLIIRPAHLEKMAESRFLLPGKPEKWYSDILGHIFVAREWEGIPVETDEMSPHWFSLDDLPLEKMWADDAHWLPCILENKKIKATFHFHKDNETIKHHTLKEVDGF